MTTPGGSAPEARLPVEVSVVVPVYNPGPYLEPCVESILRQTLPRESYEAIFVDDGSTDGSVQRLDRLAEKHANVRVIHLDPSGAPGRPRNVGLAEARGEYVQFLDADDTLAPGALERLLEMARRNDSDIVLGKFASASMARRQDLFNRDRDRCSLADTPLLIETSLGPTKLFRTAMLREHRITFPEGWRQMEDQLFTLRAYLRAEVISVLARVPCYYFNRRDDADSLSQEPIDPDIHFARLEEILATVEAETEPGEVRDRLVRRFYRAEVLGRLAEPDYVDLDPQDRLRLFAAARRLAVMRVDERIDGRLAPLGRLRSRLLRDDRAEELLELARRAGDLRLELEVRDVRWVDGRLRLRVRAGFVRASDGSPLVVLEQAGRRFLDPGLSGAPAREPLEVGAGEGDIRGTLLLRDAATSLDWIVPSTGRARLQVLDRGPAGRRIRPTLTLTAEIDPQRVGPGERPLGSGRWEVSVRVQAFGLGRREPVPAPPARVRSRGLVPALLGDPDRLVLPVAAGDRLAIEVAPSPPLEESAPGGPGVTVVRDGRVLEAQLAVASAGRVVAPAYLRLSTPGGDRVLAARLMPRGGWLRLVTPVGAALDGLVPGRYPVSASIDAPLRYEIAVGSARVDDRGRLRIEGARRMGRRERALIEARSAAQAVLAPVARAIGAAFGRVRAAYRRLPRSWRSWIRPIYRRVRRR